MAFHPSMSMGERILFIRKNYGGLSQEEFANRLGLTKSAISGYETGRRVPPDNVVKHIARAFGIDEEWLKNGSGESFVPATDNILQELFHQFDCTDFERSFLSAYFCLSEKERHGLNHYLEKIFHTMTEAEEKKSEAPLLAGRSAHDPAGVDVLDMLQKSPVEMTEEEITAVAAEIEREMLEEKEAAAKLLDSSESTGAYGKKGA